MQNKIQTTPPKEVIKCPSSKARELIFPMTFYNENGVELIEPMIFYDSPPDTKPSSPSPFPPNTEIHEEIPSEDPPAHADSLSQNPLFPTFDANSKISDVQVVKSKQCGHADNSYQIMRLFISRVNIAVIGESFYMYSGTSYEPQTPSEISREIVKHCREQIQDKSSGFIEGLVRYLLKEPEIHISETNLPQHLVAFQNCVLNLNTQSPQKHSPRFHILYTVRGNYSPYCNQSSPYFNNFLQSVTGGNMELIERILQMIGYILTPDTNAKCLFLLQGVPNSGKSVLANLIQRLFSENAVMPLDIRCFGDKFATSNLVGKAICSSPDLPASPLDERTVSKLKQLTGNDPTSSDVKYGAQVKFVCRAKLVLATNHAFLSRTDDPAFVYRVCVIPFRYSVPREQQNFDLEEKLFFERDAIVSQAMAAYFRLKSSNYKFSGDFPVNDVISDTVSSEMDLYHIIYHFCQTNFQKDSNGLVFTEDAHQKFCQLYGDTAINNFSERFNRCVYELFGAIKKRKRTSPKENARSCFYGLSFVQGI